MQQYVCMHVCMYVCMYVCMSDPVISEQRLNYTALHNNNHVPLQRDN